VGEFFWSLGSLFWSAGFHSSFINASISSLQSF
jgi:hypothetical protein